MLHVIFYYIVPCRESTDEHLKFCSVTDVLTDKNCLHKAVNLVAISRMDTDVMLPNTRQGTVK